MSDTYLAARLRAIHADPTEAHLAELPGLALEVERMERCLDEEFQAAREFELMVQSWKRTARL